MTPFRNALLTMTLLAAAPAHAVLVEVDFAIPGDALLTRDTGAGLEWLDVTETAGLSYDAVLAGAGGWAVAGFRHATTAEACGLVAALGTTLTPCPGGASSLPAPAAVQAFHLMLGTTLEQPVGPGEFQVFAAAIFDDGDPGFLGILIANQLFPFEDGVIAVEPDRMTLPGPMGASSTDPTVAHLLVRPVPEPALPPLAALVALSLSGARRRPVRLATPRQGPQEA